jgi:ribosomal protein L20
MPRVKRGVTAHAKHKKVIDAAKGFRGRRGNVFRVAKEAVMKAGQYAYRDRRRERCSGFVRFAASFTRQGLVVTPARSHCQECKKT